ncbi:MAG: site-specific integrase [Alphaproteobacteria bacterium]|nr:site-specific integrase [Alphaproteobacteria bacterium]MBU1515643.1 site-specific integrase [Alphaproteobacteria bacterium]MBU2094902.1 site-specific integrase [Alphaproteobacteria bacterium]MBU2150934.1 site-specific integrase [Alphaproteobacteria bacterium]MBU2305911.1 site-specific integrase [Alphaproteobacteria bacterium]
MPERHRVIDGKVYVYRRENSRLWQCAAYLSGRNRRRTTGHDNLARAMAFASDWYQDQIAEDRLRRTGRLPIGDAVGIPRPPPRKRAPGEKTFQDAAAQFLREYRALVAGERSDTYVASKEGALRVHLLPFFGSMPLAEVDAGRIQDYRILRMSPPAEIKAAYYKAKGRTLVGKPRSWRRPARSTVRKEIICLRQVLRTANRRGWLLSLPDMSEPYRASVKVSHRAWFSPEEYRRLYEATRVRARHPKKEKWRGASERLHDYVLFMANTGLRPDECSRLEFRDVTITSPPEGQEPILEIEVRGKRGVGYCKSMPGAVRPFERVRDRGEAGPRDRVFGKTPREMLNRVLNELGLKTDREDRPRTAYSLRHTYICLRLMEGADIYQIAKNCRTSVEMIEKFYAAHLKDVLNAEAINVRRVRRETSLLIDVS